MQLVQIRKFRYLAILTEFPCLRMSQKCLRIWRTRNHELSTLLRNLQTFLGYKYNGKTASNSLRFCTLSRLTAKVVTRLNGDKSKQNLRSVSCYEQNIKQTFIFWISGSVQKRSESISIAGTRKASCEFWVVEHAGCRRDGCFHCNHTETLEAFGNFYRQAHRGCFVQ